MRTPKLLPTLLPFTLLTVFACGDDTKQPIDAPVDTPVEAPPADAALDLNVTVNDNQILKIARQINTGFVTEGITGATNATSGAVLTFAQAEQSAHNTQIGNLMTVAHNQTPPVVEEDSKLWSDLVASQGTAQAALPAGAGFDVAYAESQVLGHQQALNIYDEVLIPQASNAALKAELEVQRAVSATHLADAKALLQSLTPDAGTD